MNEETNKTSMPESQRGKSKKTLVIMGIIIILLGASYYFLSNKKTEPSEIPSDAMSDTNNGNSEISVPAENTTQTESIVKEFTVAGNNYKFLPAELKVKKGDTVKIIFKNDGGTHDFVIDEFNAKTKRIKSGETETIQFIVDKAGTFEYYCSVGNHRQEGMKGTLTVQ